MLFEQQKQPSYKVNFVISKEAKISIMQNNHKNVPQKNQPTCKCVSVAMHYTLIKMLINGIIAKRTTKTDTHVHVHALVFTETRL